MTINKPQTVERLLEYIDQVVFVNLTTHREAIPKRLQRSIMKISRGTVHGTFIYEGDFDGSHVRKQLLLTNKRANALLPLLCDVAKNKTIAALKAQEEQEREKRAATIVELLAQGPCGSEKGE